MTNIAEVRLSDAGGNTAPTDVVGAARELASILVERAARFDEDDRFVADNYAILKEAGLVEAAVPLELGGGGAGIADLCEMLRIMARSCGSTALAFAMHTHQVAIPAWRWRYQNVAAVEPLLRRVATEKIILLSSGGSDWIGGSGKAEKVEGGYRITARKVFTSGAAAGDLLMTGAILCDEEGGDKVIHFGVPMRAPEVRIMDNWRTLGMRGTGSNDVVIDGLFIPDAAVGFSRTAGHWHPVFQIIATVAFPLIYAVYLGIAESARDIAIDIARKKPTNENALNLAGRMDTALRAAQMAHRAMVEAAERNAPSAESVNDVMIGRSLVASHGLEVTALAMELAGGVSFYRDRGLERRFRDMQAARFHPLQAGPQARYAGAMALGVPTGNIF
ncbi:acyl-CoA dehydrogenase family protein [Mesorhizobium sp. NPDC059054]|uniref:acyl-CoA dehydrogenase family protein n=1 Tax=Mesorhizobium sp. NPDC059054 TaxID=3346711 RepID=UPI00368F7FCA